MFFRKKQETRTYDRNSQKPVIRSSICTGEKVAGFQDIRTASPFMRKTKPEITERQNKLSPCLKRQGV